MDNYQLAEKQTQQWLEDVIVGLNLCPFAHKPNKNKQIKIAVTDATTEEALLECILEEFQILDSKDAKELETTLVVIPDMLQDFMDYNFFLDWVDGLIKQQDYEGIYQVATFHPDYYFHGTQPDDTENLTNRSPYPTIHLIREESMEKVLKHYPDPEAIPDNNIARVESLSQEEKQQLFPYLFR
ncbi:DUF1415 domain-containing protein [Vibrio genomosp. F10]|uniref:DUF1415 domain-containing protein n=2 Tax=Vibrio genomosp. F10 TaxID=723171 RepID=A0A1B9R040_9VIBR|nr:DUF1415 domain-containing protein [Vibrio genomosp. F10]OCH76899.1 hypothetical protein A6E14_01365 [Vibrio genomosp. F10]OEE30611.1 hypothetical protein A1QO_14870 [Vibrio genomosp. F10 str. ZF-129]OEE91368.1 hypothetical protein A1QK_18200 [Vibrio genomosp. F10 str. 9ZD137]OEE96624.1 hypothetical protein A1QM_16490 [Vibrio genomosp. F10 str. 9ZC157]OEF06698.1 hypothetical protein A1QI_18500 [Vibrio genomosp. F10 str. 9ZB36]